MWWIPLSYHTSQIPYSKNSKPNVWLPAESESVTLNDTNANDTWIVLNNQQFVDMRVNYEDNIWKDIIRQLRDNHTAIHKLNRAQLIDDAFKLFREGM